MGAKKSKNPKSNQKLTRKQLRKEERKQKKCRRHEYYTNRKKTGQFISGNNKNNEKKTGGTFKKQTIQAVEPNSSNNQVISVEEQRNKEKKVQMKLQKEMNKQRNKQLLDANIEEDKTIKHLEKQLKLNKRKTKTVPNSFSVDGLDYLLEVCDSDKMQHVVSTEQQLNDVNNEFEDDLALITGKQEEVPKKKSKTEHFSDDNSEFDDFEKDLDNTSNSDDEINDASDFEDEKVEDEGNETNRQSMEKSDDDDDEEMVDSDSRDSKRKLDFIEQSSKKLRTNRIDANSDETWEDIYGRLRGKDGSVIKQNEGKYIPPAIRDQIESNLTEDKKRIEKLNRLQKQVKGLLNRLAETNMHNIANQIENLYMNNSRNDMNKTITSLMFDSLVTNVHTPERLLMEHVMLIAILHANIGTEIGANFLQTIVRKFDDYFIENRNVDNKMLDNVVNIIAQLYNFKLFDSKLIYEILDRLANKFEEKDVECILHVLRNIGFSLRKDDPLALKNLILNLQKQAASRGNVNNLRVKFMLDILLAIKNNNVSKIPNYDTSYSEHLKKILKSFIRKGNYVTPLNIRLDDLLKADEHGKWWVIGSAWTGNQVNNEANQDNTNADNTFSDKLLELARKQRMNTDARRSIFCIIMSSEDYVDAFEKLLKLGLKNQQEREIVHVILHCCLQEKSYNPYYAVLVQKFCEYDRKFQMTIKYSIWDKLKTLNDHSGMHVAHLAKLLTHLFVEKCLPLSTLKIVQFSDLDKVTLRFMRQILLGILLHDDFESCRNVFERIAHSDRLKMFRESLRLFVHHFLLRNLKAGGVSIEQRELLESRAQIIDKLLAHKDKMSF